MTLHCVWYNYRSIGPALTDSIRLHPSRRQDATASATRASRLRFDHIQILSVSSCAAVRRERRQKLTTPDVDHSKDQNTFRFPQMAVGHLVRAHLSIIFSVGCAMFIAQCSRVKPRFHGKVHAIERETDTASTR